MIFDRFTKPSREHRLDTGGILSLFRHPKSSDVSKVSVGNVILGDSMAQNILSK